MRPGIRALGTMLGLLLGTALGLQSAGAMPQVIRSGTAPAPDAQQQAAVMKIRVTGESVTARISGASAVEVLEDLAARTSVVFEVAEPLNLTVSVMLQEVSLREAIERILSGADFIFYYGQEANGAPKIDLVRVFPKGLRGQQVSVRYIGTGQPTKFSQDNPETPEQAVEALLESDSLSARERAVEILAAAGGEIAAQGLTLALQDTAAEVKVAAIEGLAGLELRQTLPEILKALKDPHPAVRHSAVEAVAVLGDANHAQSLRPLTQDVDAGVAGAADLAIRRLADRRP